MEASSTGCHCCRALLLLDASLCTDCASAIRELHRKSHAVLQSVRSRMHGLRERTEDRLGAHPARPVAGPIAARADAHRRTEALRLELARQADDVARRRTEVERRQRVLVERARHLRAAVQQCESRTQSADTVFPVHLAKLRDRLGRRRALLRRLRRDLVAEMMTALKVVPDGEHQVALVNVRVPCRVPVVTLDGARSVPAAMGYVVHILRVMLPILGVVVPHRLVYGASHSAVVPVDADADYDSEQHMQRPQRKPPVPLYPAYAGEFATGVRLLSENVRVLLSLYGESVPQEAAQHVFWLLLRLVTARQLGDDTASLSRSSAPDWLPSASSMATLDRRRAAGSFGRGGGGGGGKVVDRKHDVDDIEDDLADFVIVDRAVLPPKPDDDDRVADWEALAMRE